MNKVGSQLTIIWKPKFLVFLLWVMFVIKIYAKSLMLLVKVL